MRENGSISLSVDGEVNASSIFPQLRLEGAGTELAEALGCHLGRAVDGRGVEKQRGDEGFFLRCFQQRVEMVAPGQESCVNSARAAL